MERASPLRPQVGVARTTLPEKQDNVPRMYNTRVPMYNTRVPTTSFDAPASRLILMRCCCGSGGGGVPIRPCASHVLELAHGPKIWSGQPKVIGLAWVGLPMRREQ